MRVTRVRYHGCAVLSATSSFLALLFSQMNPEHGYGQPGVIIGPGRGGIYIQQGMSTVDLPSDRTMARGIERAKDRIAEGEYSQAIRFLDEVLADDQDCFIALGETGEHVGLKETASNIIRDLPPAGREMYQSTFGPVARKKLKEAISVGDLQALREVSQRYFYTPAGREATLLVAQYEVDAGRYLSASLMYQELLQTPEAIKEFNPHLPLLAARAYLALGESSEAVELIQSLGSQRHSPLKIAGQAELLSSASKDPVAWFSRVLGNVRKVTHAAEQQWLMPRGNAARNGHALGGLPHVRVRWEARLLSHPQFETYHDEFWASLEQRQQPLPTAGAPLAVGNAIITTTAQNVVAVDFRTGKRIWQTQPQRISEFEHLLNSASDAGQFDTGFQPAQSFARRIWDDYLYNCISSDGERVFVIRDLRLPNFEQPDPLVMPFRAERGEEHSHANRLCAYDLATQGKLVWEIDGAVLEGDLAGAYFLGAPLVVDQKLFCLAEIKSAIHLVAIDRPSGKVAWLQQLASLQSGIYLDPFRRLQAAMPSYDSGMLVCPTGAGVVIGVDLEKNALAWAYEYDTSQNPLAVLRRNNGRLAEQGQRWIENSAVLAGGRVLLAPPESNSLHCLDLITGKLLWKRERGDGVYVAGVEDEQVLIVGLRGLISVGLNDGKSTWPQQTTAFPNNATPSGRGFFSSGKYFLPLSNAEVVAIDLEEGEVVERTKSRSGVVLGNLIAHKGAILSQNGKVLDCFDQIDVLRDYTETRLAENPADVDALRTLGELVYNEGQLARAIELLERAYELSPDEPRTREVLGECLLEALRKDFAAYHDTLPHLRDIVGDSPSRILDLLRIEAQGLLDLDKPWQSFEACLRMYEADADKETLIQIEPGHQANLTSWLRAQLASVWRQATADDKVKIAERLVTLLEDSSKEGQTLDAFLQCFDKVGDVTHAELAHHARRLLDDGQLLAAQQSYLDLMNSSDTSRAEAVANCSRLLHERGLGQLAQPFDEELEGPLTDVICLDGKTGRELLTSWRGVTHVPTLAWPYGKVKVDQPPQTNPGASRRMQVPLVEVRLEQSDGVLDRCNLFFSFRVGDLSIRDSYGREVFRQTLGEEERQIFDQRGIYGTSRGNLLILSMGQQITAIDTLAPASEANSVLWRKSMVRNQRDRFSYNSQPPRSVERPGSHRTPRSQADGRWVGVLGPITRNSVVYQDQRGLCCVDSLTGKPRWIRTDAPNACQLFGDDKIVIAVEEGSTKARVFSSLDGRDRGEVEIPRWQEQLETREATIIAWQRTASGDNRLSSIDAVSGAVAWHKAFARGSHVDVAMNRYVAVVEPTGRYVILDVEDGQIIVDHKVEPTASLRKVHLFAGTDQFLVATETAPQDRQARTHGHFNFFDYVMFDGQLLAFDASSGKSLWSRPAEVRERSLMLAQPVDAPIITFVGNHNRQDASGTHQLVNMLVLEKSSGRVLFSEENLPPSPNHCVVTANPDTHEVLVEMINRIVRFQFTDQPRPPEPVAIHEATPADRDGPQGIYRILQRFSGGTN